MKATRHNLLWLIAISLLLASCAPSHAWIPPSAPPGALIALDYIVPVPLPTPAAPIEKTVISQLESSEPQPTLAVSPAPDEPEATPLPTTPPEIAPILYYAQAADTLPVVAVRFGVQQDEITSTEPIPAQGFLNPGQLLVIPNRLGETTSSDKLMPDSEVVYSPSTTDFDIAAYLAKAGGKLRTYQEWLKSTGLISGASVITRVAEENSINPRLLLSLLEYQGGWVQGQPGSEQAEKYPMGYVNESYDSLYRQLIWAVNQLSTGYYAYREGRLTEIQFPDGSTLRLAPDLNAGTVALQYFFAQLHNRPEWEAALSEVSGLPGLHESMFGNPWERASAVEPLFPPGVTQPAMNLPFARNWTWSYTGGPHGAWEQDGAFAAIDFAPGSIEGGCSDSSTWVLASTPGLVVRTGKGLVVVDLDGDGREQTGWVLVYLHVLTEGRLPVGTWVDADDRLGRPSCEGGMATGTHVHMARKYNGEWVPADGPLPFNVGGWIAHAGDAPYKGTMTRDGQTITACTCANAASFITRGTDDP